MAKDKASGNGFVYPMAKKNACVIDDVDPFDQITDSKWTNKQNSCPKIGSETKHGKKNGKKSNRKSMWKMHKNKLFFCC